MNNPWRDLLVLLAVALTFGFFVAGLVDQPGYTDAYYYFNAAKRLADGQGLTDPYLWTYIEAPDSLPAPSHSYWMPLASLLSAGAMSLGGTSFAVGQIPFVLSFSGLVVTAYAVAYQLKSDRRLAWQAGLLTLFSGFYVPFWTTTDTFAVFGLFGCLALIGLGYGIRNNQILVLMLSGIFMGLAHLSRADGMLLVVVYVIVVLTLSQDCSIKDRLFRVLAGIGAYFAVMAPWFVRNFQEIGYPLGLGGTQTAWLKGYNELVNYPGNISFTEFLDWGWGNIINSRIEALINNLGTFVAVETWVILGPFVLMGLWSNRRNILVRVVILYAIGLHLAMTFVFAYPGYRGGLFHSATALVPFWAATGVLGLDEAVAWAARRRRWKRNQARFFFGASSVVLSALVTLSAMTQRIPSLNTNGDFYRELAAEVPYGSILMVNDPPALYYHTGLAGVVVPNAPVKVIPEIAARYGVTHMLLDVNRTAPLDDLFRRQDIPDYLRLVEVWGSETRTVEDDRLLFEIVPEEYPN